MLVQILPNLLKVDVDVNEMSFLTSELRACARASYGYDVGNAIRSLTRSLDWSIPVNFS